MKKNLKLSGEGGLTLVELLVAVSMLSLMASLAQAKLMAFTAKARQVEAKTMLHTLYVLEQSYYATNETYVDMTYQGRSASTVSCTPNPLGFSIQPCSSKINYGYRVMTIPGNRFMAIATTGTGVNNTIVPLCVFPDTWTIDEQKIMKHLGNSISACL